MSTFTMQMLKDAQKLMETAPPPAEIRVGSPLRFREEMAKRAATIEGREDRMVFGGIPVVHCAAVPENIAVLVEDGEIKTVVNFDK